MRDLREDALWRELRPVYVRELDICRRHIPDSRLPYWKEVFEAYILRLELWIAAFDKGQALTGMDIRALGDEILELRSYIFAGQRGRKVREEAAMQFRDMMTVSGFSYSDTSGKTKHVAKKGAPSSRRAIDIDACEMQQRGVSLSNIVDQLCECGSCEHGDLCMDRFRKGIKNAKNLLHRLENTRAERERHFQLYVLDHAKRRTRKLMREVQRDLESHPDV